MWFHNIQHRKKHKLDVWTQHIYFITQYCTVYCADCNLVYVNCSRYNINCNRVWKFLIFKLKQILYTQWPIKSSWNIWSNKLVSILFDQFSPLFRYVQCCKKLPLNAFFWCCRLCAWFYIVINMRVIWISYQSVLHSSVIKLCPVVM